MAILHCILHTAFRFSVVPFFVVVVVVFLNTVHQNNRKFLSLAVKTSVYMTEPKEVECLPAKIFLQEKKTLAPPSRSFVSVCCQHMVRCLCGDIKMAFERCACVKENII